MKRVFALALLHAACLSPTGGLPLEGSDSGGGLSAGSTSVAATTTSASTSTSTSTSTVSTSSEPGTEPELMTDSFIITPDAGGLLGDECDVVKQNCPAGEKCTWASAGGSGVFEIMVCVPLAREPLATGAPCTFNPGVQDGVDDCAATAICLDLGDWDGNGICTQMCAWDVLECPEKMVCVGSRTLNWCEPICDPLAQTCPAGERCDIGYGGTLCGYDWPEEPRHGVGEACDGAAQCELGATCLPEAAIGCDAGCCTPFCDRVKPKGCPLPGQACLEPYEGWDESTGQVEVGVCRLVNP